MAQPAAAPVHEPLRRGLPYEIIPTRFPGVYTSPPPPEDLDPHTADAKTLLKYGLLWRRPEATERATVRAAFERVASRKWDPRKRIVPKMEAQFGKIHRIKELKETEAGYTSSNWSGGVLQGAPGTYTTALGYWVIPSVGIPPEPQGYEGGWNSSSWIGIDGFTAATNDVLQAGIEQKVDGFGNPSYVAWYEWFVNGGDPNQFPYIYQINIPNFPVAPGQTIYCSVQYVGNTAGQLYLANDTTGDHFSITLAPPTGASFNGSDAEWIMEAPDGGEPYSSLPSFSPVQFTTALACNSSVIGNPQNGDFVDVIGFNKQLTSVALGNDAVTIDFIG